MTPPLDPAITPRGVGKQGQLSAVPMTLNTRLPSAELVRLVRSFEAALHGVACPIVQFASANRGEGSERMAFQAAVGAVLHLNKRVLFIEASGNVAEGAEALAKSVPMPLDRALENGGNLQNAMIMAGGSSLFYTRFEAKAGMGPVDLTALHHVFEELRGHFDLILIDSGAILSDVVGTSLAKMVDGTVLVVEAERTRAPVAVEALRLVGSYGGAVIGTVLSKRRYYIPRWVYRMLFSRR